MVDFGKPRQLLLATLARPVLLLAILVARVQAILVARVSLVTRVV